MRYPHRQTAGATEGTRLYRWQSNSSRSKRPRQIRRGLQLPTCRRILLTWAFVSVSAEPGFARDSPPASVGVETRQHLPARARRPPVARVDLYRFDGHIDATAAGMFHHLPASRDVTLIRAVCARLVALIADGVKVGRRLGTRKSVGNAEMTDSGVCTMRRDPQMTVAVGRTTATYPKGIGRVRHTARTLLHAAKFRGEQGRQVSSRRRCSHET